MYEVEVKAKITAYVGDILSLLDRRYGNKQAQTYFDLYLDSTDHLLAKAQRELRIRYVSCAAAGTTIARLTYKEQPLDRTTWSKPEHELIISDGVALEYILNALGWETDIKFTKHCVNYKLDFMAYQVLATVVTMDELEDTYIELEIQVSSVEESGAAKQALYALLIELNIPGEDLTTVGYMDMVRAARQNT